MKMHAAMVGLIGTMVIAAVVRATEPLTLEGALARARAQNQTLRAAVAELDAARGRLMQAGLVPANPVIAGDVARHNAPPEDNVDRGVLLAQEVEVGGQRGFRVTAAQHDLARAEYALADRRRGIDAEVRRAFAGVVAAERRQALAAESATLASRLAGAARRRASAGDVGDLEVQLAQIETTRAAQALTAAENARARATARLATAIGADPQETLAISAGDTETPPPPSEDVLVARALAARPDLLAAREERGRLESEADLTHRRGWVPNPTFSGFYRHEQRNEEIVGGAVSIPLPVWNREQGTEIAARAAARGAGAEVDRETREIPRQVHLALVRRASAAEAWTRYQRDAVPAANTVRDLIERAYAGGYLGLPDVLVQRDRLLQVRAAAIDAWLDLREAEADLIEALGGEEP